MPGVFQLSVREVADEARAAQDLGLQAVLLFGIPEQKDEQASGAYAENGIVQTALRAIKSKCPDLVTITDVCLCEYMSHGHCGVTRIDGNHFRVLNDETIELLARTALSHAAAGADIVAPSDMSAPNENVLVIRRELFDQLGAFQGLNFEPQKYLEAFLSRGNNFFLPRPEAEINSAYKQIIPYALIAFQNKVVYYVRGKKAGEQRLVAKGSIGIGGHMRHSYCELRVPITRHPSFSI